MKLQTGENTVAALRLVDIGYATKHLVASGDSNGKIYVYTVDERGDRPTNGSLVQESDRPILSLDFFCIKQKLHLVYGTSSGEVVVLGISFDLSDAGETQCEACRLFHYQGHSMGANSISTMICDTDIGGKEMLLVASGGDDQALTLSCLVDGDENGFDLCDTARIELASRSALRVIEDVLCILEEEETPSIASTKSATSCFQ